MLRIVASTIGLLLGVVVLLVLHVLRGPQKTVASEVPAGYSTTEREVVGRSQNQQPPPPPPRFAPPPSLDNSSVTTDPRSRDYDALKLVLLTGTSVSTVFDKEPRDPHFAPQREQMLREITEADLLSARAAARLLKVECKSATCKLTFVGKSPDETAWGNILMHYTAVGDALQPGNSYVKDGDVYSPVFVVFNAENREHGVWTKNYAKMRETYLASRRSLPVPAGFPAVPQK